MGREIEHEFGCPQEGFCGCWSKQEEAPLACVVCGHPAIGVAASTAARGSSNAYCVRCLREGYEAYSDIVGLLFCCGGKLENIIPEMHEDILRSIEAAGKTLEQAEAEAEEIHQQYVKEMTSAYDDSGRNQG